jgi:hypothetical protein
LDIVLLYVSEMEYKRASKYANGKIYKICSDDPLITEVYIGSTISTLNKRLAGHIEKFNKGLTNYTSHKLFGLYGVETFHIKLIECYPCESRAELFMREQYYLDTMVCINERKAYTDTIAYRKSKVGSKAEYDKIRREEKKEEIAATKKKYHEDNREKISEKNKVKYENNKHKLKERVVCECGTSCAKYSMTLHMKSKKHATLMEALSLQEHQAHAPTSE